MQGTKNQYRIVKSNVACSFYDTREKSHDFTVQNILHKRTILDISNLYNVNLKQFQLNVAEKI